MAYTYISILVLGMFVTLAYNMCANVLRAIGDSMTPLIFLILAAVLNVILDYVCILVFSMGVGGAAAATVISQVVSVVLCVIHISRSFRWNADILNWKNQKCVRCCPADFPWE